MTIVEGVDALEVAISLAVVSVSGVGVLGWNKGDGEGAGCEGFFVNFSLMKSFRAAIFLLNLSWAPFGGITG